MIYTLLQIFSCAKIKKDEKRMWCGSYTEISQWMHML
jgi:hypothetical protein